MAYHSNIDSSYYMYFLCIPLIAQAVENLPPGALIFIIQAIPHASACMKIISCSLWLRV